ncbi:MAG: hypothetical protein LBK68_04910 [Candidatus Margulisbacteria bacterium]|jgi:hypothetical protein|nr:hypothetical protein [Candidatus Margulisiibacteriota bacterium]
MTIATGQPLLASDINNLTFFPIGAILQFSGSEYTRLTSARTADNKAIWTLCNGTAVNGITVPNLVDKFLRGAASSGTTAGADSRSVSIAAANLPVHSHGAGTLSVSGLTIGGLTVDNAAAHSHTLSCTAADAGSHSHTLSNGAAAAAGGHTHTLTDPGHSHNVARTSSDSGSSDSGALYSGSGHSSSSNTTGITIDSAEAHTHTVSGTISDAAAHSHTISSTMGEGGSHSHTVNSSNVTISGGTISGSITGGTFSGSTDNTGSGTALTIATLPSYYTVVYIIKVA